MSVAKYTIASRQQVFNIINKGAVWMTIWARPVSPADLPAGFHGIAARITVDVEMNLAASVEGYTVYWQRFKKVNGNWQTVGGRFDHTMNINPTPYTVHKYMPQKSDEDASYILYEGTLNGTTYNDLSSTWRVSVVNYEVTQQKGWVEFTIPSICQAMKLMTSGGPCYVGKSQIAMTTANGNGLRTAPVTLHASDASSTATGNIDFDDALVYSGETVTVTNNSVSSSAYSTNATFTQAISVSNEYLNYPYSAVNRTVTWVTPQNCTMTVLRDGEVITSPATVVIGNVISYTVVPNTGYKLTSASPESPFTCSGLDDETITVTVEPSGTVTVRHEGAWKKALVWVMNDGSWKHAMAWIRNNNTWKQSV